MQPAAGWLVRCVASCRRGRRLFSSLDLSASQLCIEYARQHTSPEPRHAARVREQTAAQYRDASKMITPGQGALLAFLISMISPRDLPMGSTGIRCLELGCFTGYSALWMVEGMRWSRTIEAPGSKIITCERDAEIAAIARENFQQAGVTQVVDVRHTLALDLCVASPEIQVLVAGAPLLTGCGVDGRLRALPADQPFDFVFMGDLCSLQGWRACWADTLPPGP